jgi:hypothetical protein
MSVTTLSRAFVAKWDGGYQARGSFQRREAPIFDVVGPAVRDRGYFTLDEFLTVACWNNARPRHDYAANSEEEVNAVTAQAIASPPHRRVERVDGRLRGVQLRTATALCAVFSPHEYAILDVRAVESLRRLHVENGEAAIEDLPMNHWDRHYWTYNEFCRVLAARLAVPLRSLDRALLQWASQGRPAEH